VIAGRSFVSVVDDDESVRESLGAHPFRGSCHLVRRNRGTGKRQAGRCGDLRYLASPFHLRGWKQSHP